MALPHAPACARNGDPIRELLRSWFADRHRVLAIGSGTGEDATDVAAAVPQRLWQASALPARRPDIATRPAPAGLPDTPPPPLALDVTGTWPGVAPFDAVFSANTLHIMAWPAVAARFSALPAACTADAWRAIHQRRLRRHAARPRSGARHAGPGGGPGAGGRCRIQARAHRADACP